MKIYTNLAFWDLFYLPLWWFYYRKPSFFNVSIKHTGAHHSPMCQNFANFISIRTILVLDWRKWPFFLDFLAFYVPLCCKKLSVQCSGKLHFCASPKSKYPVLQIRGFWWYRISVFEPFRQSVQYWKKIYIHHELLLRVVFSCFHGKKIFFFTLKCLH